MDTYKIKISLTKLNGLVVDSGNDNNQNYAAVLTLNAEMMQLGFVMTKALFEALEKSPLALIETLHEKMLGYLKAMTGSDVTHRPMYPNFPEQVINTSSIELYFNALCHYWTYGQWLPEYKSLSRSSAFEAIKYREIDVVTETSFRNIFTTLVASADSLSDEDKGIISWFMRHYDNLQYPDDIPFAENKCVIIAELMQQEKPIFHLVKTATDVLRVATYLSEGDVSLATNTKFKSLPRKYRKLLVRALEKVINEEDIGRHRNKWVRLFHGLHVGELSNHVNAIAKKARNNETLASFYSKLEALIKANDFKSVVDLLRQRPGEFGRRLDQTLRMTENCEDQILVANAFLDIADKIPTRNLLQLLGHIGRRASDVDKRVIFPKGNVQKAVLVNAPLEALDKSIVLLLKKGIESRLIERFSKKTSLGNVWIDPELMHCPVPSQQRSAAEGLFNVARGTRLPIGDKSTLRFFIYWVGLDIDLSASFHDEQFQLIEYVSYTNLKSQKYKAYHSGDITRATNGASEFIDIDINSACQCGARYVVMNVLVFNGPTFEQHETCYAGWMTRSKPNSNEVYDPKTVEQKIDVRTASRNVIPVVFDLLEHKAIWVDVAMKGHRFYGGNNIESNYASIEEKLEAVITMSHKLSLYDLFSLHTKARGARVKHCDEADTVFSLDEGVTPFHINDINADYID